MTDEQTKQAILGFTEFFKDITGNQNLEIPSEIAEKFGIQTQADVFDKIKDEIERMDYLSIEDGSDGYDKYVDRYDVLQIIDKYKAESEEYYGNNTK